MDDSYPRLLAHQSLTYTDRPSEEKQEACAHCGEIWYAAQHKNGICRKCQQRHMYGMAEVEQHRVRICRSILIIMAGVLMSIVLYFLI